MNETSGQLFHPTLVLFLYDVRERLGQSADEIERNRHHFWRKLDPELDRPYDTLEASHRQRLAELAKAERPDASEVELFHDPPDGIKSLGSNLNGYCYPLQLGDTYALQVEYAGICDVGGSYSHTLKPITILSKLKQDILDRLNHQPGETALKIENQGEIGQTWLIWGKLPGNHPDSEEVAKGCLEQFAKADPHTKYKWSRGKFAGASLYERWLPSADWHHPGEGDRVVVCLFPPRQEFRDIQHTMQSLTPHLLRLFYYRNKILWAYRRSRELKNQLRDDLVQVEEIANQLQQQVLGDRSVNIPQSRLTLSRTIELLSRYTRNLSYLEAQGRTIEIHLQNYQKRLEKLAELDGDSNLEFFSEFRDFARENYQWQVEVDNANLKLGVTLLESAIQTMRGRAEIQQAMSDRELTLTITSVGTGLAVSQVTAAVVLAQSKPPTDASFFKTAALWWSTISGLTAGMLVWSVLRVLRK